MENLHYEDRLKHLGLTCLDRRGSRSDLIEILKIISGMYDIRQELFFDFDEGGRRGHSITRSSADADKPTRRI